MDVPLTAEIHRDGEWFVAFCPEVPEANGQGHTRDECITSLREAVLLLVEDDLSINHDHNLYGTPKLK